MVRYFYAYTPLVIVGTLCILALPWLGLIALAVVALVALPVLAFALVVVPYMLGRAVIRAFENQTAAAPRPAVALAHAPQPTLRRGHA